MARKGKVHISSSQIAMRVPRRKIEQLAPYVARAESRRVGEVDVAVVDAGEMARLNERYLSRAGSTDVISFDLTDRFDTTVHAQIVVCADVAVEQARRHGRGPQRELLLYVTHGLLHVMGYDDREPDAAARMHAREEQLLAAFLASPRTRT